ncbi:hypothetical protein [Streptomyces sp. NPDC018000]|uniref:hypothetical protein n=1 Tax=Streptomyces sp. NPDC018000 TaxID=3365028 RepID=UPI0037ABB2E1
MGSSNHSKPPSSTSPFRKPASRYRRRWPGRRSEDRPGHEDRTLERVADPDEIAEHRPSACADCGEALMAVAPEGVIALCRYGPGAAAPAVCAQVQQRLPSARTAASAGSGLSEGFLAAAPERAVGRLTRYIAHPRRGAEVVKAAGVLPYFTGTAVTGAGTDAHAVC